MNKTKICLKSIVTACSTTLMLLVLAGASVAQDYDTVINNGRVIDPETGLDAIRNVGIKDGSISSISEFSLKGATTINAKGLVVAPGWIDLHAHGMEIGALRMQAMQGVTTALELESGLLMNVPGSEAVFQRNADYDFCLAVHKIQYRGG